MKCRSQCCSRELWLSSVVVVVARSGKGMRAAETQLGGKERSTKTPGREAEAAEAAAVASDGGGGGESRDEYR